MQPYLFSVAGLLLLSLQFSCNETGRHREQTATEKKKINNDGVDIAYDDSLQGDTTLLFVHGWCINKEYWTAQADHFRSRYRVVAVDLPGFGASGKNRDNWTVEAYAKDLSTVMEELDLRNVVLVGHSMSGQIIVETAMHNKERIIGLVGVDNFKFAADLPDTAGAAFYKAARQDYKEVVLPSAAAELFLPSTDSLIRQRVLHDIAGADPIVAIGSLSHCDHYPGIAHLAALKKRIYLINSDATPTDTAGLRKRGVLFTVLPIHASGHYPMVEKPAAFNAQAAAAMEKIQAGE